MKNVPQTIHAAIVVLLGVLLLIFVKAPTPEKQKSDYETSSKSVSMTRVPKFRTALPKVSSGKAGKVIVVDQAPAKRLIRFEELKNRVLLDSGESTERKSLLSDQTLVEWIASNLTMISNATELKDRLSMIDFLEDAVTWKENPNHDYVLSVISDVILSDSFLQAQRNQKRQLIGDKIELFTILSEQAPDEALLLRSKVKETKLESILDYAAKRLPVGPIKRGE